jgi:hypothetical protein
MMSLRPGINGTESKKDTFEALTCFVALQTEAYTVASHRFTNCIRTGPDSRIHEEPLQSTLRTRVELLRSTVFRGVQKFGRSQGIEGCKIDGP